MVEHEGKVYSSIWDFLYTDKALVKKIEQKSYLMMTIEDHLADLDQSTPDYDRFSALVQENVEDVKLATLVAALESLGLDVTVAAT